jgi:hypothetical protein
MISANKEYLDWQVFVKTGVSDDEGMCAAKGLLQGSDGTE